jgi:hypothetical protein
VVVLYSEVNESETDDIMTRIPKKKKKNDKQSFLSMNFYLWEGEEFSFFHYQTQECRNFMQLLSTRIQFNAKLFRNCF